MDSRDARDARNTCSTTPPPTSLTRPASSLTIVTVLAAWCCATLVGLSAPAQAGTPFAYVPHWNGLPTEPGMVSVVNVATQEIATTIDVGPSPNGVAVARGKVYVSNCYDSTLSVIDPAANRVINTIALPGGCPALLAPSADGSVLYASSNFLQPLEERGAVSLVDTATDAVTNTASFGIFLFGLVFDAARNRIYVADQLGERIYTRQATTLTPEFDSAAQGAPSGLALLPDGSELYATGLLNDTVSILEPDAGTLIRTIPVANRPTGIVAHPTAPVVFVASQDGTVSALGTQSGQVEFTMQAREGAVRLAVLPDATHLAVVSLAGAAVSVFNIDDRQLVGTVPLSVERGHPHDIAIAEVELPPSICGNARLEPSELCDDGNQNSGDCCAPDCRLEVASSPCVSDDNPCTQDVCDANGTCTHAFPVAIGCQVPASRKSALVIKDSVLDSGDKVTWKWKGETTLADIGNPSASTALTFCVGDAIGRVVFSANVPAAGICGARNCWRATKNGYRYLDPELTPDGIRGVAFRASSDIGSITLEGSGVNLRSGELPVQLPVVARVLRSDASMCWESVLLNASRNDIGSLRVKSD